MPKFVHHLGLILVLTASVQLSIAETNEPFKDDIKRLKLQAMEPAPSILWWDEKVVAEIELRDGGSRFVSFTVDDPGPRVITVPGCDRVVSLTTANGTPIALAIAGKHPVLMQKVDGEWAAVPGFSINDGERPRLIPSTTGIALLTDSHLYCFRNGKWLKPTAIPLVPRFYSEFKPEKWGKKQILYNQQLIVGWNHGEWGGMVAALDVSTSKPRWVEVSGKKKITSLGIVGNDPVTGMTIDSSGKLWISEGCAHMGGMWRGLFSYDGAKWETIVNGAFDKDAGGITKMPGEPSDIADVFTAPDRRLYVLAGAIGVLTYTKQTLTPVLEFNFYDISQPDRVDLKDRSINTTVPCYPHALVVDTGDNLFISTHYYGILCFKKRASGYRLEQIVLPSVQSQ